MTFCPERLTLARERRGATKRALAERVGLSSVAITQFEKGERTPGENTLLSLAQALAFPPEFFTQRHARHHG
ncbi:MAG: hypothetical protein SangKO_075960 [Sandaracinaceae bacterium]